LTQAGKSTCSAATGERREAAAARTGAAIWNRRDAEVSVTAEVAGAYLRLRTLQARIANVEAELARLERFEQLVAACTPAGW
jgi:outer membrane protein TolC